MSATASATKDDTAAGSRRSIPLSILDLAAVGRDESIAESFAGSVELARAADEEKLDWSAFLQQGQQWLQRQAISPADVVVNPAS